ncbi:hypothetical protein [Saccharicrinis sp. FJH54]|uniref:hypothetical protein n=1 Tax=Saccharicrinis sp. FJH54 TaxID=3344665 RepID=UPI0035D3E2FE
MKQMNLKNKLRLFTAIFVILFSLNGNAQVVMPDQLQPGDSWGLIDVNNLYGGFMQVADYNALLNIDVQFVKKGMVVIVYDYDGINANGIDTRSFMFLPAAGTWNYTSPFDIPAANQNDVVAPENWVEVSIRPVAGVSQIDTVSVKALIFDGDTIRGFSTDPSFANATDSLFPSQLAVSLYVDSLMTDLKQYGVFDTIVVDTAFINGLAVNYFSLNNRYITDISNDSTLTGADSLKLITEYSVQTRIDSVLAYVNGQFSALSQNMIEDTQDGESMVKVTDGDSVIVRVANDTAIVVDQNRNVTFNNSNLIINGDSLNAVADKGETFANEADSAKAVTSLATVDSMIVEGGNNINFAFGTKTITRAGWDGVTGAQMNVDNLEDFLKKLFFPVSSPLIQFFGINGESNTALYSYQTEDAVSKVVTNHVGTATVPYSNWNGATNYTLGYNVYNRSVNDESDDTALDSIVWLLNGVRQGVVAVGNLNSNNSGTLTLNKADLNVNATGTSTNNLEVKAYDAYPNMSSISWILNTSAALQSLVQNNITITHPASEGSNPYLIERNGATQTFTVSYNVDARDETVTDVVYTPYGGITAPTNETGLTITGNGVARTTTIDVANTNLSVVQLGVQVRGNIYNTASAEQRSPTIQLADRGYVGYLTNAQRLDISNQGATIAAFSNASCLMNYQFKTTNGVTLANGTGETAYLCFALPVSKESTGKSYKIQTYDLGVWSDVTTGQVVYDITTNGATVSYYVVYINSGTANTSDGGTVQARIIEN